MVTLGSFLVVFLSSSVCLGAITDPRVRLVMETLPPQILLDAVSSEPTPICNGFWQSSGYVCDAKKAIAFNVEDQAFIDQETQHFNTILSQLSQIGTNGLKNLTLFSSQMKEYLDKFTKEPNLAKMKEDAQKCWQVMKKFRSTSLCFACTANNYQFYRMKLALISSESCEQMITDCNPHFSVLGELYLFVHQSETLVKDVSKERKVNEFGMAFLSLVIKESKDKQQDRLGSLLFGRLFSALFRNFVDVQAKHKEICEKSISLRRQPILLDFMLHLKYPISILNFLLTQNLENRSLYQSNWRFLNTAGLNDVTPIVSSVPEVTVLHDESQSSNMVKRSLERPFNMSLVFP